MTVFYKGPNLLSDLCGALFHFRTLPVAMFSDIELAFLQVGIWEANRDVSLVSEFVKFTSN